MLGSGVFVCLFSLAYFMDLHSMAFFIFIQIGGGLLQATGWPSVVSGRQRDTAGREQHAVAGGRRQ